MRKKQFLSFVIITVAVTSINVIAVEYEYFATPEKNFEEGAQLYSATIDKEDTRHAIYLVGNTTEKFSYLIATFGENLSNEFLDDYRLRYIQFSKNGVSEPENVTNFLVFRYHYEIVVDSSGNVHTTFIANNYTLYYAVRSALSGIWEVEPVHTPDQWSAFSPHFDLNEQGEVRIVYVARYNENANIYNNSFPLDYRKNVHLSYKKDGVWVHYDLSENLNFMPVTIAIRDPHNPAIAIENGKAYVGWGNRATRRAKTEFWFLAFPEDPTVFYEGTGSFTQVTWRRAFEVDAAVTLARSEILIGPNEEIHIGLGSLNRGGLSIIYLQNASTPPPEVTAQFNAWSSRSVELDSRIQTEVVSLSGIRTADGQIHFTWALRDQFDTINKVYSFDVFLTSLIGNFENLSKTQVTGANLLDRQTPEILLQSDGVFEISYFEDSLEDVPTLFTVLRSEKALPNVNAEWGFALVFFGLLSFTVGAYFVIRLIKPSDIEEELLPHQINLKDSIIREE